LKIRYRASRAVTSKNSIEFSRKPTYIEKLVLIKIGVFQQNRPLADLHVAEILA